MEEMRVMNGVKRNTKNKKESRVVGIRLKNKLGRNCENEQIALEFQKFPEPFQRFEAPFVSMKQKDQ